jgi:hypothetical protein
MNDELKEVFDTCYETAGALNVHVHKVRQALTEKFGEGHAHAIMMNVMTTLFGQTIGEMIVATRYFSDTEISELQNSVFKRLNEVTAELMVDNGVGKYLAINDERGEKRTT